MAAIPTLISVDEYLHTGYPPDRPFIDGKLEERNEGEYPHTKMRPTEAGRLELPGTPIDLVLSDLFAVLDRA